MEIDIPGIADTVGSRKEHKNRERKKHLLSALQKQVEFYFGDANLRHDRFMRRAIQSDAEGFIAVQVIADFNKLKQISSDARLVLKAMKNSSLLEVTEDGSKVRRILPLPEKENTDAKTVYVERLPPHADQDWLREVFSCCGNIDYISLPRYKNTREIKGFAFIEYSSAAAAEKACQVLNSVPWKLNYSPMKMTANQHDTDPGMRARSLKRKKRMSASFSEHEPCSRDDESTDFLQSSCRKLCSKRRRCHSESSGLTNDLQCQLTCNTDQSKELKDTPSRVETTSRDCDDMLNNKLVENGVKSKPSCDFENSSCLSEKQHISKMNKVIDTESQNAGTINVEDDVADKKRNKKEGKRRTRKKKTKEEKSFDVPPLYVITKKEWLRLKEMYKNLQRGETKTLKINMKQGSRESICDQKVPSTIEIPRTLDNKIDAVCSKPLSIPVTRGTILQVGAVTANEMSLKQSVKKELGSLASIAYIDINEGENQGFIRLSSHTEVQSLMKIFQAGSQSFSFSLKHLSESEENSYHQKIEQDRRKKFSNKQLKKERGMDKINRKFQASLDKSNELKREHIYFQED